MRKTIIKSPLKTIHYFLFIFSIKNKTNAYEDFIEGCIEGMKTTFKLFPFILSMYFAIELLRVSNIFYDIFSNIKIIPIELLTW